MKENAMDLILLGVLVFCSIQDLLKKKISLWMVILGGTILGALIPFYHTITLFNRLGGVAVGGVVILISIVTGGKIGFGDGLLLCISGIALGFWNNLELFALALLLAALVSIALIVIRSTDRKKSIPFVPCLLFGYLFILTSNISGRV